MHRPTGCAGLSIVTRFAILAIGAYGVAILVKDELAVQCPVPVAVRTFREADGRHRGVVSVIAILAGLTLFTLRALFARFTLRALFALFALRALFARFALWTLFALFALRALFALFALRALFALFTLRALWTLFTFRALWTLFALRALWTLFTLRALWTLFALRALWTLFTLRALWTLFAFLAVVDGDRVRVAEADGVTYNLATLLHGRHGGDIVRRVQQLLQGGDVVVHLVLPLFEGGEAFFVVAHRFPQGSVVVIVLAGGKKGTCEETSKEKQIVKFP